MKKGFLASLTISFLMFFILGIGNASTIVYSNANSLGDYSNGGVTINVNGLAPHSQVYLNFDLYILDSWDGSQISSVGPDYFGFSLNGNTQEWTFDNFFADGYNETNPDTIFVSGSYNGIYTWQTNGPDRLFINYNNGFAISDSNSSISLYFYGRGLQGLNDESWRVENVTISTNADSTVPEPTTLLLLGFGLLGMAGVSRRKN